MTTNAIRPAWVGWYTTWPTEKPCEALWQRRAEGATYAECLAALEAAAPPGATLAVMRDGFSPAIARTARSRGARRKARPPGPTGRRLLDALASGPLVTPALAAAADVVPKTASSVLRALERRGLVRRLPKRGHALAWEVVPCDSLAPNPKE